MDATAICGAVENIFYQDEPIHRVGAVASALKGVQHRFNSAAFDLEHRAEAGAAAITGRAEKISGTVQNERAGILRISAVGSPPRKRRVFFPPPGLA